MALLALFGVDESHCPSPSARAMAKGVEMREYGVYVHPIVRGIVPSGVQVVRGRQ